MVIWKDIGVLIRHKCAHVKRIGSKLRLYLSFIVDNGNLPVARINEETGKLEEVVNTRGRAYAARKRQKYWSNKVGNKRWKGDGSF